jgi:excisionase family DNA binding protein
MTSPDRLLKTREVARVLGVSVSTIKRWIDSGALHATRTMGRHRLVRLSDASRFAQEQGLSEIRLEASADPRSRRFERVNDESRAALLGWLREGKAQEARSLIHSIHASGSSAPTLADDLIRPVMEGIGHGWMVGLIDIYQEHLATQVVESALLDLIEPFGERQAGSALLAIGAAIEGDPYVLPGLLGELVLRELGWDVRNLGVNLPLSSLANAVLDYRPRLVFLSVNYLTDEDRFVREYTSFFHTAVSKDAAVILGGRALGPLLRSRLVFASYGDRMVHLAEFARRFHPRTGASDDLAAAPVSER